MIIELIGPQAAGKTTVAPLVAARLDIAHYRGQGFHGLDGQRLTGLQAWGDRVLSVARAPRLYLDAMRMHPSTEQRRPPAKERGKFALNTCRRNRFAAKAARAGSGIMESGPLHALCQASAGYRSDLRTLLPSIFRSDFYVRLAVEPEELRRRFEARGGRAPERVAEHVQWVARYEETAEEMLRRLDAPVREVDGMRTPDVLADEIAALLAPVLH